MIDKVQRIKEWISKTQDGLMDDNGNFENTSDEGAFHVLSNLDYYIDSLQEEPVSEDLEEVEKSAPIVYVVTRCEEHSDYVEKVFFDGIKAEDYCKLFEGNENQYGRDITKVEVTL